MLVSGFTQETTMNTDFQWHLDPPAHAGTFIWRRNYQWEPVEREVDSDTVNNLLTTYSHRYAQQVLLPAVGGEWFYGPNNTPGTWEQVREVA